MTKRTGARTGGRILVDQLKIQGCDRIFTVPGESFLAVLDALHDTPEIDTIVCRQEGGVAYMADADGKMTGRPGIVAEIAIIRGSAGCIIFVVARRWASARPYQSAARS